MPVPFSPDATTQALGSLRRFCTDELDLEVSDIQVRMLLDFFRKELAPTAYNAGIQAAEAFLRDRVADLAAVQEPEFAYWPKGSAVRRKP